MYIGSVECDNSRQWLVNENDVLHIADISYCPGLFKIFDEIITNASDNKQNDGQRSSSRKETYIKVKFSKEEGKTQISVENDGIQGFIQKSTQKGYTNTYIPELAFGILMTSSNYDDNEQRVTGGRNGYGAKLTNIYSTKFTVEVVESGQYYKQTWTDNMSKRQDPVVTEYKGARNTNFIRISFIPDYVRFHMSDLTEQMSELLKRRVWDIAGCTDGVKVFFNDKEVAIHGFHQYCQHIYQAACPQSAKECLLMSSAQQTEDLSDTTLSESVVRKKKSLAQSGPLAPLESQICYYEPQSHWSIAVFPNEMREFQQLSFVNSINTIDGGSHVDYILDQLPIGLTDQVRAYLKQKEIKMSKDLTKAQVKNSIFLVVRCLVVNPSFDSQTKVSLKTTRNQIKKDLPFSPDDKQLKNFYKQLGKNSTLMEMLSAQVSTQINKLLSKTDGAKTKHVVVPKLDDAIYAGTAQSSRCYLYLTEGDSAKTLAVEGISKLKDGRKYNGVFPLRGKVLNVREQTVDKVSKNEEIANLKKILGLRQNVDYSKEENRKTLRYGKVVIMADQDTDGSHIKGLILNLFDSYWPSLLRANYVQEFITPIVRVERLGGRRSGGSNPDKQDFYTLPQFHEWLAQNPNTKQWKISYYKGLGSSDKKQAAEYFQDIQKLKKEFIYDESSNIKLNMAFNKKLADQRKIWLTDADPNTFLDNSQQKIKVSDFVDKELVLYELENIGRSIPSVYDGFKPSQRKIIYSCFKRNLNKEVKVAQLSGYVSEHSAYHHGEVSLQQTIVALAQCFCGANNIPLLVPKGQFGSRPRGGQDSAAARYIHTLLQPITRYIFIPSDDQTLTYLNDDGQLVEPEYYIPIIPMILVNGTKGIATGWSTSVQQYNPRDLIDIIRKKLYHKSTKANRYGKNQIKPWYRFYEGDIIPEFKDMDDVRMERVYYKGRIEIDDSDRNNQTVIITELPIGKWTEEYREQLIAWMTDDKSKGGVGQKSTHPPILQVNDYSDNDTVRIEVQCAKGYLDKLSEEDLINEFGLISTLKTTNMMLHAENGKLKQFDTVCQIIDCFFNTRMVHYKLRKEAILQQLEEDKIIAEEKARFIQLIIEGKLEVKNVKIAALCDKLWQLKFLPQKTNRLLLLANKIDQMKGDQDEQEDIEADADEFEAEKLLRKNTKDITDKDQFFAKVTKPSGINLTSCYSFLTKLAIQSMTAEKYEDLKQQALIAEEKYEELKNKTLEELYLYDLAALDLALEQFEANLSTNDTEKPINIKEPAILRRMEEVQEEYEGLKDATGDSDTEPVLIERKKAKAEKAPKSTKSEKDTKETKVKSEKSEPIVKRPSLLTKAKSTTDTTTKTTTRTTKLSTTSTKPAQKQTQTKQQETEQKKKQTKKQKKVEESSDDYSDEDDYSDLIMSSSEDDSGSDSMDDFVTDSTESEDDDI